MAETVIVRQDATFRTEFRAPDPRDPESDTLNPVAHIHELTPYGMLLAGLGSCTAIVLHTYAQHHDIALEEVELRLSYDRIFAEDCRNCEFIHRYEDRISEEIVLRGDLDQATRDKLLKIAHQCPIQKMLEDATPVASFLSAKQGPPVRASQRKKA